jgi:hypothetical protein
MNLLSRRALVRRSMLAIVRAHDRRVNRRALRVRAPWLDLAGGREEPDEMPGKARVRSGTDGPPALAGTAVDRAPLLAEQLALLVHGAADVPWLGSAFGTCLVGALLAELATRGRVVVEPMPVLGASTIRVVDPSPLGDDLLDDALRALVAPVPLSPRAPYWVLGAIDRRRIRKRGTVQRSDLWAWWNGSWSTSEVPRVAPTLLRQVLTVHECLHTVMSRVNGRLGDLGLVEFDRWGRRAAQRGDRWCSGFVEERMRAGLVVDHPAAAYAGVLLVPELRGLMPDVRGHDPRAAGSHAALAAVVSEIVVAWKAWSQTPG